MSQSLIVASAGVAGEGNSMTQSADHLQPPPPIGHHSVNFDYGLNTSHAVVAAANLAKQRQNLQETEQTDSGVATATARMTNSGQFHQHHPRPLPMPEYGGWFAPLTEFLPSASQPVYSFHRCNLAVVLLADLVVDGLDLDCQVDWSVHVPIMLHIAFLGLDNSREIVHRHCQQLLLNLLMVLCEHNDHLTVSSILMNTKTDKVRYG